MESFAYKEMFDAETTHWWYCARRKIIGDIMSRFVKAKVPQALDIGCGTGMNNTILKAYASKITGIEQAPEAILFAQVRAPDMTVIQGSFPEHMVSDKFDLVTALDVLEHLDDDAKAVKKIEELLGSNGIAVITVPAYNWLWSHHDTMVHHKRRYTAGALQKLIKKNTHLQVEYISYMNTLLFFPIVLVRFIKKMFSNNESESDCVPVSMFLNTLFKIIFSFENILMRYIRLPFGVSIICVLKKEVIKNHPLPL